MQKINRVLIIGAAGSLGTKLSSSLVHEGYYVIGVDVDENNLAHLQRLYNIPIYLEDIRNSSHLEDIIQDQNVDVVVNTAAMKHVHSCEINIEAAINTNIMANLKLIRFLDRIGKKFVYISSDKAIKPRNIYALTKQLTDYICCKYGFRIVRGVNFLNSRGSVLDIWERQRITQRPFSVVSEPCRRYFITVGQMTSLVLRAILDDGNRQEYTPEQVYEISIHDLFAAYLKFRNINSSESIYFAMPENEKIQEDLNFSPEIVQLTEKPLASLLQSVLSNDYLFEPENLGMFGDALRA